MKGSTVIDDDEIMYTETGRITKMAMYSMSLFESLESNGSVSLRRLFDEPDYDIDGEISQLPIVQLIFAACRGGWRASLYEMSEKAKLPIAKDYVEEICNKYISRVDKTCRNLTLARLILRSYARNICRTEMKNSISQNLRGNMPTATRWYIWQRGPVFSLLPIILFSPNLVPLNSYLVSIVMARSIPPIYSSHYVLQQRSCGYFRVEIRRLSPRTP